MFYLNVSNYNYTLARSVPVVQQIVGPLSLLKNAIGTVSDVSTAIFSFQSFTAINNELMETQKEIKNKIAELEDLRMSNENLKDLLKDFHSTSQCDLEPATRFLLGLIIKWNLQPISQEVLKGIQIQNDNSPMGQYLNLHRFVDLKIQTEVRRLVSKNKDIERKKCVPLCDRLGRIAKDVLTTIPVVGTLYNLPYFIDGDYP